jgi:sulfur relay (sulfurtransferase) complex TusBCD TusD component (DsrE family)
VESREGPHVLLSWNQQTARQVSARHLLSCRHTVNTAGCGHRSNHTTNTHSSQAQYNTRAHSVQRVHAHMQLVSLCCAGAERRGVRLSSMQSLLPTVQTRGQTPALAGLQNCTPAAMVRGVDTPKATMPTQPKGVLRVSQAAGLPKHTPVYAV